jgi:hypothetical protein
MIKMRTDKLEELNLRSTYKVVSIQEKEKEEEPNETITNQKGQNVKAQKELKRKIDVIQDKMNNFLDRFKKFESINNAGFQNFMQKDHLDN